MVVVRVRDTTVAFLPATVVCLTESDQGMYPAGYQTRMYVIDSGARALTIQSRPGPPKPRADEHRAAADRLPDGIRLTPTPARFPAGVSLRAPSGNRRPGSSGT